MPVADDRQGLGERVVGPQSTERRSVERVKAAAIATGLALLFFSPFFSRWSNWGIEDWDQHAFYHEAARVSLLRYGQVPQWNPYCCGGTDLLANPQSRALHPTFPLILLFGTVAGLKIEMILFAVVGMLGVYALGRHFALDRLSAWIAPIVYFLGPAYALPVAGGMTWILSTAYLPWVVLACVRGLGRPRWIVLAGAGLALMYLGGGAYPVPITLAFIAAWALLSMPEHGLVKPVVAVGAIVVVMMALGAVKFFPSIGFLHEFPRRITEPSGFSAESLTLGLFHRDQRLEVARTQFDASHIDEPDRMLRGISSDYDDVGMYIGPLVAALFAVGIVVSGRSLWKLAIVAPLFLWLSLGDRPRLSLFAALHRVPVYDAFRYPERFRLIWLLIVCLFAGCGLRFARERVSGRFGTRAGWIGASAALAVIAADLFVVTRPIYRSAYPIPPIDTIEFADYRQVQSLPSYDEHGFTQVGDEVYGAWSAHYPALLMNLGVIDCYETAIVPRRAVPMSDPAYRGEVHLEGADGEVTTASWSPNRLRFALDVKGPATLVVNQNYYASWRTADGRPVTSRNGLISVEVGPNDHAIELRYGRSSFSVGLVVSSLSWIAAAWFLMRQRLTVEARPCG